MRKITNSAGFTGANAQVVHAGQVCSVLIEQADCFHTLALGIGESALFFCIGRFGLGEPGCGIEGDDAIIVGCGENTAEGGIDIGDLGS